jgi:hypothetical protein
MTIIVREKGRVEMLRVEMEEYNNCNTLVLHR